MSDWYYKMLGEEFGPFPFDTMKEFVREGQVGEDDEVRTGDGRWQLAKTVAGLFDDGELDEVTDLNDLNFEIVNDGPVPAPAARPAGSTAGGAQPDVPRTASPGEQSGKKKRKRRKTAETKPARTIEDAVADLLTAEDDKAGPGADEPERPAAERPSVVTAPAAAVESNPAPSPPAAAPAPTRPTTPPVSSVPSRPAASPPRPAPAKAKAVKSSSSGGRSLSLPSNSLAVVALLAVIAGAVWYSMGASLGGEDPRREIYGQIKIEGKPVVAGKIVFTPVAGNEGPTATGEVSMGRFHIQTSQGPGLGKYMMKVQPEGAANEFTQEVEVMENRTNVLDLDLK